MRFDLLPAKDDPHLKIQAYYVRLNALGQLLSPLAVQMLEAVWEATQSVEMCEFRRSQFVGSTLSDLIRALSLEDAAVNDIPVGDWFVYTGSTRYGRYDSRNWATARIELPGGQGLVATVRGECQITNTAGVNMQDADDISFIVGRRLSETKFDLVAAGYRDPWAAMMSGERRRRPVHLLDADLPVDSADYLPRFSFDLPDYGVLAYAVHDAVARFSKAISAEGAWRLLYKDDGSVAHESRHQNLFRLFSQQTFNALRIGIHPGADHGQGPTDFTLVLRDATHVIEFKKDAELNKILHGMRVQLPAYMAAAGTKFGTYAVMCHVREPDDVEKLLNDNQVDDVVIAPRTVDCRRKRSASKA